jgi:glucosyl-dolichyl phosphate glucuronosyltransferase
MSEQAVTSRLGIPGLTRLLPEYRTIGVGLAIAPAVSVVLPAKNEARNLGHVLATIPAWVDEIVLLDGHPSDDTVTVPRQLCRDEKIVVQGGRRKGDALQAGFQSSLDNPLFGTCYTDLCNRYNAFWARPLPAPNLDCTGFGVGTVMNNLAAWAGLWIQEIPGHEHLRVHGESNLPVIADGRRLAIAESEVQVEHVGGSVMPAPAKLADHMGSPLVEEVDSKPENPIIASDATVVVATYNPQRWPFIEAAVESLLSGPDKPRHVVICVDQNEELYKRIKDTWPQVTATLNTGSPGASGTRNTGAEYADTPFIVFLDDDVSVHEGWLTRLLAPFADPTVVGTGGGVVAVWQAGRPKWFPEEFGWVVGASYRGMPTVRSVVRNVWSENMAVRADVFRAVGGFRIGFGKVGNYSRPEDTDLCIRMAANVPGASWVYEPDAIAAHHVPVSRTSFSFFLRRTYLEGRGKLEMARLLGRQEKLQNERDYLRRTLPSGIFAGLWAAARHGEISGLLKAGAMVAGVLAAAVGATVGMRSSSGGQ